MKHQLPPINGKYYLFTGWWQIIGNNEMLVSNSFSETDELMSECEARYVELTNFTLRYTEHSSVAITYANLHQAYSYPQNTSDSSPILSSTVDYVNNNLIITTTIFSAITNLKLASLNGYYLGGRMDSDGKFDYKYLNLPYAENSTLSAVRNNTTKYLTEVEREENGSL